MTHFSLIIALCASVVVLTEANQTLLIQYNYPLADNFSYIELQCVDNSSQTAVLGSSFQLNGTTIAENSQQSEIFFTLTQENEGFFICSLDGLSSTNTIGLAAQPKTNYSDVNITYAVELPDMDSTVMTELVCDIQPGALIQRYSVQWLNSTSYIVGNTFNVTVNISASSEGETYHCTVFIDHNGQGLILSYSGRHIIIATTTPNSGLTSGEIAGLLIGIIGGTCCCSCSCMICYFITLEYFRKYLHRKKDYTKFFVTNQDEINSQRDISDISDIPMPVPLIEDNTAVPSNQGNLPTKSHQLELNENHLLQSVETMMETTLPDIPTDPCISWHENITADNEPTPSPCSGPAIDPYNTENYIPKWFNAVSSHLHCTQTGRTYYDDINDFGLEIPEGAIPRGETISIDIGVALYGPFQFPPGMRPVSPVFWVCVRQTNFSHFLKPITITLPHFLSLRNQEGIQSLGLTFLKAQHEMNHHQMYEFQPAEGKVYFEPFKKSGVFQTTHFCSLCISCKDTMEAIKMATFCVTAVIPRTFSADESSYAVFYVTFLLGTCLKKLREQLKCESEKPKEFQFRKEGEQALELILPDSLKDEWSFLCKFENKIYMADVDFFVRDPNDRKKDQLKTKEENGMYPPSICVDIACSPPARTIPAKFQFIGATKDLQFAVHFRPPPFSPPGYSLTMAHHERRRTTVSGSIGSAGSSGIGQDEVKVLAITDLFEALSKLTPVAGRWKYIGLALGLDHNKLSGIEKERSGNSDCLMEMLSLWLNKAYKVTKFGEPTWQRLSEAVRDEAGGNNPSVADDVFEEDVYY